MDRFTRSGYSIKEEKAELNETTEVLVPSELLEQTSTSSTVFLHSPVPVMPPEGAPRQQY